ncbi:mRNA capping enzyme [Theobroma cacao]|nr:mRNA capping enzyme [Theobroma cacao]
MIASMDLNASQLPEDDEETHERHIGHYSAPGAHVESAVEERRKRLRRYRPDHRPVYVSQPPIHGHFYQNRNPRVYDKSRIPPGWLDCPSVGREIGCTIPSKVPLGESYDDCVPPVADDDDGGGPTALHGNHQTDVVLTNDDILGDEIPHDQQESLRSFCYKMLELNVGARRHSQFPGSHPVSLNRDSLQLLRQRYYYTTWKVDGTRYMMLITVDGCYLIDRSFNFPRVQMRFPSQHQPEVMGDRTDHFTLLDGEMVIDTMPDSQKQGRRYLIYDMMALNHVGSLIQWPFCERWKMPEKDVIEPRKYERQNIYQSRNPYYRYDLEPFRVRRKDFWFLSTVNKVLKEIIPRLSHKADGLIFQGWDDPYVPRTHEGLLKWKYAQLNSVDFLFEIGSDDREQLFLYQQGRKKLMEGNRVEFRDVSDPPSSFSGKIIECCWDPDQHVWIYMRIRTDKSTPNDFNTFKKVKRSIKDNITDEILLNEINESIRLPMYADRIKIDSKAHLHTNSARRK